MWAREEGFRERGPGLRGVEKRGPRLRKVGERGPGPDAIEESSGRSDTAEEDTLRRRVRRQLRPLPRLRSPQSWLRCCSWWRNAEDAAASTLTRLPSHPCQLTCHSHQALLQCASAVLSISRESSERGSPRDVQRGAISSPSTNPAPSREPTRCHRARGSRGQRGLSGPYIPERAEGRAPLGPAPPRPTRLRFAWSDLCPGPGAWFAMNDS